MGSFRSDIRRWPDVASFAAHLNRYDPRIASWATGLVVHHTAIPTISQWRGMRSMRGMRDYYQNVLRWDSGPQLYVAVGTGNPEWDGIYQLTALNEPGIHAGPANPSTWGIEFVGNYDVGVWSRALEAVAFNVMAHLLKWRGLPCDDRTVRGHRDWMPRRSTTNPNAPINTCPGVEINMTRVRAGVQDALKALNQPAAVLSAEPAVKYVARRRVITVRTDDEASR